MPKKIDYSRDFAAFFRDLYVVEGAYGPKPLIPPFLASWLSLAFPLPGGNPAARNILDARTKKEGKSALAGAVALYMASRKPYQEVVIVAADKDQAKDRVLRSIKYGVENGPLANHAQVFKDAIELDNKSTIQAMPSDWRGAAGGNYSCVIFDELHSWVYESNRRLFDELVIPPTQPEGVRWIASYAGFSGESLLLEDWWNRALAGEKISDELPIYRNEAASLLAFVDVGRESWRMPWMSEQYIEEVRASERPNTFRRIWLNEWVSGESQFLPEGAWEACYSPQVKPLAIGDRRKVVFGADASTTRDLTALVGVEYNKEANTSDVVFCRVWQPRRGIFRMGKPTIDLDETIGAEVKRLHEAGQLAAVICDPFQLHNLIIEWEKLGIRVIEFPQVNRTEADQSLYDGVIGRAIRHFNHPTLNEHIRNAVAIESVRGWKLAKEKTSQKIDAAVALSMAHYGALETQKARGEIHTFPNIFYGEYEGASVDDFAKIGGRWSYLPDRNRNQHPQGVTWRNCRNRNRGCDACIEELEMEGFYEQQNREAAMILAANGGEPMSEEQYWQMFNSYRSFDPHEKRRIQNEQDFLRKFRKAVTRRLAGGAGKNQSDA